MKVIRNECVHNHATVATVVSIGGFHTAQGGTGGGGGTTPKGTGVFG